MAVQIQLRRGTTAEHSTFTGALGEITMDTTKNVVVLHNGSLVGGFPLALASGSAITAASLLVNNNLNISTGNSYQINGTSVLNATTLGSGVTASSLTSVGTLSSLTVSGNLTVDTNTLYVDAVNNRVGVGTASPGSILEVAGKTTVSAAVAGDVIANLVNTSATGFGLRTQAGGGSGAYLAAFNDYLGNNRLLLDASGNLGVGGDLSLSKNTSTAATIRGDVSTAGLASRLSLGNSIGATRFTLNLLGSGGELAYMGPEGNFPMYFQTNGTERARITAGGDFGIGTTNPTDRLEVQGGNVKEITSTSVNVLKYGKKTTIAQSSLSNPVVDLLTIGNVAVGTLVRVTVFQYDGSAANANVHIGYAYIRSSSGSVTAMSAQGGFGTQNVGTLSWSGQTLRYTANRVGNFDIYAITVEVASESSVSGW